MVEDDDGVSITVSGLNKKVTVPYLLDTYGDKVFEAFQNNLYIPAGYTGKNTHTYIDDEMRGVITDYLGNKAEYYEKSGIHLGPADYSLSIDQYYMDILLKREEIEVS